MYTNPCFSIFASYLADSATSSVIPPTEPRYSDLAFTERTRRDVLVTGIALAETAYFVIVGNEAFRNFVVFMFEITQFGYPYRYLRPTQ